MPKSGTNRFHGSLYDLMTNSDWNSNTGVNQLNGDPKPVSRQTIWGYSLGGKPGGRKQALPDLHAESGALHVIG